MAGQFFYGKSQSLNTLVSQIDFLKRVELSTYRCAQALKNRQNICAGIPVTEVLPILSSNARVIG